MHNWRDKRPDPARLQAGAAQMTRNGVGIQLALLAISAGLAGCASPGPPQPPSLQLPAVVEANALTAIRVGDTVALHWTTPTRTTDKLPIKGPITAVVCRNLPPNPSAKAAALPCSEVVRLAVTPGPSDAVDPLPAALTVGPPRPLAYRVELLNAAGHTAGPSPAVLAVAGAAPDPVADLRGEATKPGVLLRWRQPAGTGDTVELTRITVEAPKPARATAPATSKPTGPPGKAKQPAESHFEAGSSDLGGTLDRSTQIGYTYSYIARRVRTAEVGGQTLKLRSTPSIAVTVPVRDVFPPEVPTALVAVPGFAGEGEAAKPVIDLSWEPDVEPRVAGYRVYRREGDSGAWQRLGAELIPSAAYRDALVVAGHTYTYRVTAVSDAGNESAPSAEVSETAPAP